MKKFIWSPKGLWMILLSVFISQCGQTSQFTANKGLVAISDENSTSKRGPNGELPEVLPSIPGEEIDPELGSNEPRQNPNGEPGINPNLPVPGNIPEVAIPTVVLPPQVEAPGLVTQSFQTTQFGQGNVQISMQSKRDVQQMEMLREYSQKVINFSQDARAQVTDIFSPGKAGVPTADSFIQLEKGSLDVILNVDSSASMKEEQINLADKFKSLIGHLEGFDWQIAVNTADPSEGCIRDVIRRGDADAEARFATAVNAGVQGSPLERGLYQAQRALEGNCWAGNWVRENSVVAVIAVSDEDECSSRGECPYAGEASADNLLNYLKTIRTLGVSARVYGLFWHPSQDQSQCSTAFKPAYSYADAVDATNGTWGSICDASYDSTLVQMSKDMAQLLKSQFRLAHIPDQNSVQVSVNGLSVTSGYQVNGNNIIFNSAPAYGASISVNYTYGGTETQSRFELSETVAGDLEAVFVNNRKIDKSQYSFDAKTNELVYPAPLQSQIKVVYKKNTALSNEFDLKGTVHPDSLEVFVDGAKIPTSMYRVIDSGKTLQFINTPIANASLKVKYAQAGAPVLYYPHDDTSAITSVYEAGSKKTIAYSVDSKGFYIQAFDWQEGRQFVVSSQKTITGDKYVLEHTPLGTVLVKVDSEVCEQAKIKLNAANEVDYSACLQDDTATVRIAYKYVVSHDTNFTFDEKLIADKANQADWKVYVNGKETTAYRKNGFEFQITEDVELGSLVSIRVK